MSAFREIFSTHERVEEGVDGKVVVPEYLEVKQDSASPTGFVAVHWRGMDFNEVDDGAVIYVPLDQPRFEAGYVVDLERDGLGGWVATVPDMPGCRAVGKTRSEAIDEVRRSARLWRANAKNHGRDVPQPKERAILVI